MKSSTDLLMASYGAIGIAVCFQVFLMAWMARGAKVLVVTYGDEVYATAGIFAVLFASGIIIFLYWIDEYLEQVPGGR